MAQGSMRDNGLADMRASSLMQIIIKGTYTRMVQVATRLIATFEKYI